MGEREASNSSSIFYFFFTFSVTVSLAKRSLFRRFRLDGWNLLLAEHSTVPTVPTVPHRTNSTAPYQQYRKSKMHRCTSSMQDVSLARVFAVFPQPGRWREQLNSCCRQQLDGFELFERSVGETSNVRVRVLYVLQDSFALLQHIYRE
jgi:hypothetical protein